jgi:hypothetical protein
MAGVRHGMCELTQHGMAGELNGDGKGAAWHLRISVIGSDSLSRCIQKSRKATIILFMAVCPHGIALLCLHCTGFSVYLMFECFKIICRENASFFNLLKPSGYFTYRQV